VSDAETMRQWPAEESASESGGGDLADVPVDEHGMATEEAMREALKAVMDPEIGINVVDLGLLYHITKDAEQGGVHITMTLTSMGCPLTELIQQQVEMILTRLPGVEHAEVEFTFTPPWSTDMISEEAREELRAMGFMV
jgi:metal-sulfur cluster biosynthetic enzyme